MAKSKKSKFDTSRPEKELGSTGLRQANGVIYEEFVPDLKWPKQNAVYKQMAYNDATIAGILFAMKMVIRKVDWKVNSNGDDAAAEFLETCLHDMEKSWADTINDILSFLVYGFSVHEIVYKLRTGDNKNPVYNSKHSDGYWGWRKLPTRSQDSIQRWVFEGQDKDSYGMQQGDVNNLVGVVQRPWGSPKEIYIPKEKVLLFRNNTEKDNPESVSILRGGYRSWYFKKHIEEIEAIGIERNLLNIPIAWIPPQYLSDDATPEQASIAQAFSSVVANMKSNEQAGMVLPLAYDESGNKIFDLKLLGNSDGGSSKVMDTNMVIQRHTSNIAQSVLADFILLGQQSVGSFALSSNKTKLFHSAISSWLDSISSVFNKEAIPSLFRKNGFNVDETMPTISYGSISDYSLEELADYFGKLVDSGAVQPSLELQEHLMAKADAPEAKTEIKTTEEKINDEKIKANKIAEDKSEEDGERTPQPEEVDEEDSNEES